ncbi:MAG: AAA family ATPase [Blastocatellia bacterium]|nr:AAA family ATPase [Blastocatellia bacterium]
MVETGRYECTEGTSSKYWQITLNQPRGTYETEWGRIGCPNPQGKTGLSEAEARKKIAEKLGKGYVLKTSLPAPAVTTTAVSPAAGESFAQALASFSGETNVSQPPPTVNHLLATAPARTPQMIGKVVLPYKGSPPQWVPRLNPHYHFPDLAQDVVADLEEGRNVLLVGQMGSGKTSLAEQLAARMEQGVLRANLNGQMEMADFVGTYILQQGECVWVDGVLPQAMRQGLWLILDELDFGPPRLLCALNAVLERGRALVLKERNGEVIAPHPDFRLLATANTIGKMSRYRHVYQGTNLLNAAFLRRWRTYVVEYPKPREEVHLLGNYFPHLSFDARLKLATVANAVRTAFEKEEITVPLSTAELIDWCELMARTQDALKAAEPVFLNKMPAEDAAVVVGIIKRVLGV